MKNYIIFFLVMFSTLESQTFTGGFPAFKERGAAASTIKYYCIDNGAGCSGRTIYNAANLGTYLIGKNTLRFMGGEAKVNRCGYQTITGVNMYYRVYTTGSPSGAFTVINYTKSSDVANACSGKTETWKNIYTGDGIAISNTFPIGNYTLEVYYEMITSSGTVLLNNSGDNYKATFTMIDYTTWDGTTWDNGSPASGVNAIVNGDLVINTVSATNNLTINTGTVTVAEGYSLKAYGNVINNGTIVVENDATFLQENGDSYSGTGNAIVYRGANLKRTDFNYWSSPVSGQNLYNFSIGTPTSRFYIYNEATDTFITTGLNASSTFSSGWGYAIRGKQTYPTNTPVNEMFSFTGIPNSGPITITLKKSAGTDKGYNLIGNPYPSNINFGSLFNYSTNKNSIYNKQWFWTNLNAVTTQQGSDYAGNNYATFVSGSGGVGPTYVSNSLEETSLRPQDYTKVAQGFIVQAKYNNAPLIFNNGIRSSNTTDSIFFNKNQSENDEGENQEDSPEIINRYWLKLITPQNIGNTILIAYNNYATNEFDSDYDADLLSIGNDSFYSSVGSHRLQIQSRANSFSTSDQINLGIKCSVAGNHIIALDGKDGIFSNQAVYLKDNSNGSVHNLQNEPYIFFAPVGEDGERFKIIYQDAILNTNNSVKDNFLIYKNQFGLNLKSDENINQIEIYDVSGKLIYSQYHQVNQVVINTDKYNKGIYIIKIFQKSGVRTKKVIL
ncbi:MAG: hypothetical protein DI529_06465 [Chryseobacterium sp.]|nr:MAG: hypothetical protein DI529_06465 [Chryseobacterium sp.]